MPEVFAQPHQRCQQAPNPKTITKILDSILKCTAISENFIKGLMQDTSELRKQLHRNLV
jgi:hypothetical protein